MNHLFFLFFSGMNSISNTKNPQRSNFSSSRNDHQRNRGYHQAISRAVQRKMPGALRLLDCGCGAGLPGRICWGDCTARTFFLSNGLMTILGEPYIYIIYAYGFDICILYKIWGYITKDHRFSLGLLTSKKIWIWKRWMKFKPWGNFASNASRLIHNSKVSFQKTGHQHLGINKSSNFWRNTLW